MSFQVQIGTVNKRINSTYQPTTELIHTIDVVLKESCSDYTPTFILKNPSNTFPYNYLKWGDWYYYITNVIRDKNQMITVTCTLDELATFKNNIVNSIQFVAYDSTANTELIDTRLSRNTTEGIVTATANWSKLGVVSSAGRGTIVLGCVTDNGLVYYAMSQSTAGQLLNDITNHALPDLIEVPEIGDLTDVAAALDVIAHNGSAVLTQLVSSGSASKCIVSAKEIALSLGGFYGSSQTVYLGSFSTTVSALAITGRRVDVDTVTLSIPWTYNDWRRNNPYTQHYFYSPFIGLVALPEDQIIGCTSIYCEAYYDMISGDIVCELYAVSGSNRVVLGCYSGSIACEYALGSSNIPLSRQISTIGALAGGLGATIATGNPAVGATAAITGTNLGFNSVPSSISGGGGGACLALTSTCRVIEVTHNTNVDPSSVSVFMGTPTMVVKSLAGLSGYVECRNASVAIDASSDTINRVNNMLNGGIYIE